MTEPDIDYDMEFTLHRSYLQQLLVQLYHHFLIFVRRDQSLLVKNIVANAVLSLQFCNHNLNIKSVRCHFSKFQVCYPLIGEHLVSMVCVTYIGRFSIISGRRRYQTVATGENFA